ncbi:ABC transporter ATP-binding protein [Streptomyces griseus]|uniref:ABC transporter ATP-binding protein n=1 Tax=Streptomyces griseus TaxID=1911 RepID=UPI0033DEE158
MIVIDSLSKRFDTRTIWRDINLTVSRGEMLSLTGPSGSGKSTLLNCLGLLENPSGGAIQYEGRDISKFGRRESRLFRRDTLGYLFQHYALIDNATVAENLEVATKPNRRISGKNMKYAHEALDRVGLLGREKDQVHHLSGGEQQRVALARLIIKRPSLVLADEPTGALDEANGSMVVDILREMSRAGCTVIIATHDGSVRDRCDSVFDLAKVPRG